MIPGIAPLPTDQATPRPFASGNKHLTLSHDAESEPALQATTVTVARYRKRRGLAISLERLRRPMIAVAACRHGRSTLAATYTVTHRSGQRLARLPTAAL